MRDGAEITAECNPNDLTPAKCADLRAAGINRISMGVQSMDNGLLAMLGRRHDADEAVAALDACRQAGFDNVNLDLMYGLPNQTLEQWRDTVQRLLAQAPEHISMYSLTLEDGTPLKRWVEQGRLPEPDPDLAADMYDLARASLRRRRLPPLRNQQLVPPRTGVGAQPGLLAQLAMAGRRAGRAFVPRRRPFLDGALAARLRAKSSRMG